MDTSKWKSVLLPLDIYLAIRQIAQLENRTISGQLRVIFNVFCETEGYEIRAGK